MSQKRFPRAPSENHLYDFDQWTLWELNGYPEDADLPSYRVLQGKLNAYNPATGWVAFNVRSAAKEKELCTQNIRDSISSLVSLLETGTPPFHVELSGEQQSLLNAAVAMPGTMKYAIHYSRGQVNDIIENVKTCLLEHIASLRKEGKIETGKELPSGARQATDDAKIDKTVFISHRSVDKYIADILLAFQVIRKEPVKNLSIQVKHTTILPDIVVEMLDVIPQSYNIVVLTDVFKKFIITRIISNAEIIGSPYGGVVCHIYFSLCISFLKLFSASSMVQ